MNIRPCNSKIFVEEIAHEEKVGNIHLPSASKEERRGQVWLKYGHVRAVGPGHDLECGIRRSMDVSTGDIIGWPVDAPAPEIGEGMMKTLLGKELPHLLVVDMGHVQCKIIYTSNGYVDPDTSGE